MKLVAISDTHMHHEQLEIPRCDLLVHAGDATWLGKLEEVVPFLDWFAEQPADLLVFVPGNHDWLFELQPHLAQQMCRDRGILLLNDDGVHFRGQNLWGVAWQAPFNRWAFNVVDPDRRRAIFSRIPDDTDILITHQPAYLRGDSNGWKACGDPVLLERVEQVNPHMHISGHLHEDGGIREFGPTTFVNATILDWAHKPTHSPHIFELEQYALRRAN